MKIKVKNSKPSILIKCPYRPYSKKKNDNLIINGDYALGQDILEAIQKYYNAEMCCVEEFNEKNGHINIVMRGNKEYNPLKHYSSINICYLYANFDEVSKDEIVLYDAIITASKSLANKLQKSGAKAYYAPQFTNVKRFYHDYNADYKAGVLFIGSAWKKERSDLMKYLSNTDIPLSIYGHNWGKIVPASAIKAEMVENSELYKYYSSADIVLNQTNSDMRENNVISNRIFDVTACKGFIISDYVEEIENIYGDSVPMYQTKEGCEELIRYYLAHPEERRQKAEKAYEITINTFTSDIFAGHIKDIIDTNKFMGKKMVSRYVIYKLKAKYLVYKLKELALSIFSIRKQNKHDVITILGIQIKIKHDKMQLLIA